LADVSVPVLLGSGAALLGTALFAAPAFAQTTPPAATAPMGTSSTPMGASSTMSPSFIADDAGHWRASKLAGVDVYGPNNEKVGDINEVLLDRNGQVAAVVIGATGRTIIARK